MKESFHILKYKFKLIWPLLLLGLILYLIYQNHFVDHSIKPYKVETLDKELTLMVVATEKTLSSKSKGFSPLLESLRFWDYDENKEEIYLRESSLLPGEYSPLLFVYDQGGDSFVKQENVFPISTFPYSFYENKTSFEIKSIDEDGTIYFTFQNKHLALKENDTYMDVWNDGFHVRRIHIKNYGFFKNDQFKLFDGEETSLRE